MRLNPIFIFTSILLTISLLTSCQKDVEPPKPYGAIPSKDQLAWQQLEYYMFVHFGPNTFTDVEWGNGKEDPKVFNPTNVDCRQWASTAKAAGMKGIIITAKHHDGFCLWPSKYSTHTVRESSWKDGKGDLLKELSEACREYGLKFGVYLSPWDQNHPDYGTPAYNQIFANTLNEVLSSYGEVFEQWFDGANGGAGHGGKEQIYDWNLFHQTVYKNQPHAVIFSDVGPGCRWMGNERGVAGETNWSTLNTDGFEPGAKAPAADILNVGNMNGQSWVPAETDVSIRPGWFYSPSTDDKVKSIEQLMSIYYTSIGRNSNLLLNVPPDRGGRIHKNDSIRLMEFRKTIDEAFKDNLAKDITIITSATRGNSSKYDAKNIIDGEYDSYWTTDDNITTASIEIDFKQEKTFNRILLQEYIPLGQRIANFNIEYWNNSNSKWELLTKATTIGYKRILRFPTATCQKIRINILESLACPIINNLEIYKAHEELTAPTIERNKDGIVTLKCPTNDPAIYYTTDGSEPSISSTRYLKEFDFKEGGTVKAVAIVDGGKRKSETVIETYYIAPKKWSVISPSDAQVVVDGNRTTYNSINKNSPLVIDLSEILQFAGFSYTPVPQIQAPNISKYNFWISSDGENWEKISSNAIFNNMKNSPVKQDIIFNLNHPVKARYIKIDPIELTNQSDKYTVAEIEIINIQEK